MTHDEVRELLPSYLAAGLSADERAAVEAHLAECVDCSAEQQTLRSFELEMGGILAAARPAEGLEERVLERVQSVRLWKLNSAFAKIGFAAAACTLFGTMGYLFQNVVEQPRSPQESRLAALPSPLRELEDGREGERLVGGHDVSGRHVSTTLALEQKRSDRPSLDGLIAGTKLLQSPPQTQSKGLACAAESPEELQKVSGGGAGGFRGGEDPPSIDKSRGAKGSYITRKQALENKEKGRFFSYDGKDPATTGAYFSPDQAVDELKKVLLPEDKDKNEDRESKNDSDGTIPTGHATVPAQDPAAPPKPAASHSQSKIIRNGEMEFEIEAFDTAVLLIMKIVAEEGGFVATVNSEKLPNGKARGSIILRCPPDRLDTLILKLRGLGELRRQNITSQDVTKEFTDYDSQLRAARAMEERLLDLIKNGKGSVKDLLLAEKELGEWRTKIEQLEGHLRYLNNLISLSTLSLTLYEKEIRSSFGLTETERVEMGVEVEDVKKAYQEVLALIADAKGRVVKSELKQHDAGQFNAVVHFEVAPDAAGAIRDRLSQIGTVARLDVDRAQNVEGGAGRPIDPKVTRTDTRFFVSLYNLANIAPRETVQLQLACTEVEKAYNDLLERMKKTTGRILSSTLNRQERDQSTAVISVEVKKDEADAFLLAIRSGDDRRTIKYAVVENADTRTVTKTKMGFQVQLVGLGRVTAGETVVLQTVAKESVPATYARLRDALSKIRCQLRDAHLNESDRRNVSAFLDFEILRESEAAIREALNAAGYDYSRTTQQTDPAENVLADKLRYQVTLIDRTAIPPRETLTFGLEVSEGGRVQDVVDNLAKLVADLKGTTIDSTFLHDFGGRVTARVVVDVPLSSAATVSDQLRKLGVIRAIQAARNAQVPENEFALARLDITISNETPLLSEEQGFWAQIRDGFGTALRALAMSLRWVIVGLFFAVPIGVLALGGSRAVRRMRRQSAA